MWCLLQTINQTVYSTDKSNLWGISSDAWFTGLTPILIFILGYIVNEIIKNCNEQKRLKELEKYFKKLIELLNKPLNKQKEEFLKFSHSLKEKNESHLILNEVTNFHVEQIKEISSKDLYTVFIKNKRGSIAEKTELYGKLRGNIDYIDSIIKSKQKYFDTLLQRVEKYQDDYNNNIVITDEAFRSMSSQSNQNEDLFLIGMGKIINEWSLSSNNDINYRNRSIAKEKYIKPMIELCKQHIDDSRAVFIGNHIKRCIYALNNDDELKRLYRRLFLLEARGLQQSWFEINAIMKKFDSM